MYSKEYLQNVQCLAEIQVRVTEQKKIVWYRNVAYKLQPEAKKCY